MRRGKGGPGRLAGNAENPIESLWIRLGWHQLGAASPAMPDRPKIPLGTSRAS